MKKAWKNLGTLAFWGAWPLIYLNLRFSKRTKILVSYKDSILLVKNWLGPHEWSLPGGGIRLKEEPHQGALRELHEETGIKIDRSNLEFIHKKTTAKYGFKFKYYFFIVKLPKLIKPEGISLDVAEVKWFNRTELKDIKLAPLTRELLKDRI